MQRRALLLIFMLALSTVAARSFAASPTPPLPQDPVEGATIAADDPDALYMDRADLTSAKRAADLWQAHASTDYDAAWKLARVCYWLGTHLPEKERTAALDRGIAAGQDAAKLSPKRPEAHFWTAANMGERAQMSELYGVANKAKIKAELELVIKIEPGWQGGSAEAALGQWYAKVPSSVVFSMFGVGGGDPKQAEAYFRRALAYDEHNKPAMSFYADFLIEKNRKPEARKMLERLIADPIEPDWAPEEIEFKRTATERLKKLG